MFAYKIFKKDCLKGLNSHGVWVNGADFYNSINYAYPHFTSRGNLINWKIGTLSCSSVCLLLFTCAVTPCPQFELIRCMLKTKFSFVFFCGRFCQISLKDRIKNGLKNLNENFEHEHRTCTCVRAQKKGKQQKKSCLFEILCLVEEICAEVYVQLACNMRRNMWQKFSLVFNSVFFLRLSIWLRKSPTPQTTSSNGTVNNA